MGWCGGGEFVELEFVGPHIIGVGDLTSDTSDVNWTGVAIQVIRGAGGSSGVDAGREGLETVIAISGITEEGVLTDVAGTGVAALDATVGDVGFALVSRQNAVRSPNNTVGQSGQCISPV